ncbi:MAG: glycosyltransferase family A protein [Alcanivorax sp.]
MAIKKKILKAIKKTLRPCKGIYLNFLGKQSLRKHNAYYASDYPQKPHNLDGELVVSLTSYPPRYKYLLPTLESLLAQTIKADRIVLAIAKDDMNALPEEVLALKAKGLEILETQDLRSFKKLIPALDLFPNAYIVTTDDDVHYPPSWLEGLVAHHDGSDNSVVCNVGHGIVLGDDHLPVSYKDWNWCINNVAPDTQFIPIGVGGVLYSPKSLKRPEVFDNEKFMALCPYADDLWFYFMGKINDAKYIKAPFKGYPVNWPGSQEVSLSLKNTGRTDGISRNDTQLKNLIKEFGNIFSSKS